MWLRGDGSVTDPEPLGFWFRDVANGRVTWRAVRASPRDPKQALGFYSRVSVPDPGRVTSKVSSTNRHHRGVVEDDTRTTTVFRTSFSERDVAVIERPSYCSFSNAKHVVAGICGTLGILGQPPKPLRHDWSENTPAPWRSRAVGSAYSGYSFLLMAATMCARQSRPTLSGYLQLREFYQSPTA